jgi:hypothetical protein
VHVLNSSVDTANQYVVIDSEFGDGLGLWEDL